MWVDSEYIGIWLIKFYCHIRRQLNLKAWHQGPVNSLNRETKSFMTCSGAELHTRVAGDWRISSISSLFPVSIAFAMRLPRPSSQRWRGNLCPFAGGRPGSGWEDDASGSLLIPYRWELRRADLISTLGLEPGPDEVIRAAQPTGRCCHRINAYYCMSLRFERLTQHCFVTRWLIHWSKGNHSSPRDIKDHGGHLAVMALFITPTAIVLIIVIIRDA